MHEIVEVPGLPVIGPYSQAVKANGLLFVSGQGGIDPATKTVAGPTFADQGRQAFENLRAVLANAGSVGDCRPVPVNRPGRSWQPARSCLRVID